MSNLLRTAIDFAHELHAGQRRKSLPLPYITHPADVVRLLVRWGIEDYTILSAAMLHDALEDCDVTPYTMSLRVGPEVTRLVEELTYDGPAHNAHAKKQWLESFLTKSPEALVIKLADRHENVRDYTLTNPDYAKTYLFKAYVLLDALFVRLSEINNHFGNSLGLIISDTFCRLEQEMGL